MIRVHIQSFIKIDSDIQKSVVVGGIHTQAHRQEGDFISLLLIFQKKKSRLIKSTIYST
jgi:hypothetical protein